MASITREPNGRWRLRFMGAGDKRLSIFLGKMPQREAERFADAIDRLAALRATGQGLDPETIRWVAGVPQAIKNKLVAGGLMIAPEKIALGPFLAAYAAGRTDVKPGSRTAYKQAIGSLVGLLGANRALSDVTEGDAEALRIRMAADGYAQATIARRIKYCRQFFAAAVRQRLVDANPFQAVKVGSQQNRSRFQFVSRQEAAAIAAVCPDAEWRLLFALARFGGLRVPSEVMALRWCDVNWQERRLLVHSPKTARHEGKATRVIPLFPELVEPLNAAWDQAEPGTEYIIARHRCPDPTLRNQLERIARAAGLVLWPKPFQNCRSTRETELADEDYPVHVVCDWIGNSPTVAARYYLQTTEAHFARATGLPGPRPKSVQHVDASQCNQVQPGGRVHRISPENSDLHPLASEPGMGASASHAPQPGNRLGNSGDHELYLFGGVETSQAEPHAAVDSFVA